MGGEARFTVTTAIHYVNGPPHVGHAYETILADVLARAHRLRGDATWFLTGTDEHGQKIERSARDAGTTPQAFCDGMTAKFRALWTRLGIAHDDFVRTTEPRHVATVQAALRDLSARGRIYPAEHEGWYCTPDERFWTDKDVPAGACPMCARPVERIRERNHYFRMSGDQEWLVSRIEGGHLKILPETRRNEVLGFLRKPLEDLCISRPRERVSWGIPLPFDDAYVTYVWFDALLNYVSAPGYPRDPTAFAARWPAQLHVIGKDILTPHAVYWPIMLRALGLPLPEAIFAHGWWLVGDAKMGKSAGNAIDPLSLVDRHGADAFRYYLVREMPMSGDTQFGEDLYEQRYQADLANGLGNLLQRTVQMIERYAAGRIPPPGAAGADEAPLASVGERLPARYDEAMARFDVPGMISCATDLVSEANRYVERTRPWALAKSGSAGPLSTVLAHLAEALRLAAAALEPVLPATVPVLRERLGATDPTRARLWRWDPSALAGAAVSPGAPLFPREGTP